MKYALFIFLMMGCQTSQVGMQMKEVKSGLENIVIYDENGQTVNLEVNYIRDFSEPKRNDLLFVDVSYSVDAERIQELSNPLLFVDDVLLRNIGLPPLYRYGNPSHIGGEVDRNMEIDYRKITAKVFLPSIVMEGDTLIFDTLFFELNNAIWVLNGDTIREAP